MDLKDIRVNRRNWNDSAIVNVIKKAGNIARIVTGKPTGKIPLERPRRRWILKTYM
jgi:hypothetical protein